MIYDRTQQDVDEAKEIVKSKVNTFSELTEDDVLILERGRMTLNTLNRIEGKTQELRAILIDMGYYMPILTIKEWIAGELFTDKEFQRILKNIGILKKAFYVYEDTPNVPEPLYHFQNVNDMEKILYDLERFANELKSKYKICGQYICGGAT